MAKTPAVTIPTVLTVGLALGATTALFSVFDGLVFRPLPYKDAGRIVRVQPELATWGLLSRDQRTQVTERFTTTSSLVERATAEPATLFDPAGVAVVDWDLRAARLSPSAFNLLGVRPWLGRAFGDADTAGRAALLGYDLWRARFGGDSAVVDRVIELPGTASGERWTVLGVMPQGFSFPEGANFWVLDTGRPDTAYARLAPHVEMASLRAELPGLSIIPLREHIRPAGALALGLLLAATALMLLVAWVQVAALLFARATGRIAEIGVRLALGATRIRLIRQFSFEAGVLILLALALAALVSPALTTWIVDALPPEVTIGQHVSPDFRAFTFAALLSGVGVVVLSVLPAELVRLNSALLLLRGRPSGTFGLRTTDIRRVLFVAQLAITTSLVYLTALALQSFVNVERTPLGFAVADLYAIRMPRGDQLFGGSARDRSVLRQQAVGETIARLRSLPGITAVAGANAWPMRLDSLDSESLISDADPDRNPLGGRRISIQPGYPTVLGVRLLAGAEPTPAQLEPLTARDQWYALANETLARHLERFGPPVGQVIGGRWRIVGVLPDLRLERADLPAQPTVFLYLPPIAAVNGILFRLEPGRTLQSVGVSAVLEGIWQRPAPRPFPVADAVHAASSDYRARTLLMALVASLTIPLTMLGVSGALTYSTKQRARDIAIELAIGAKPRDVRRRVVREAITAAAIAVIVGLALGIGIGRLTSAFLFGVGAIDLPTILGSVAVVLAATWAAALIPASRASRFAPARLLRE